MNPFNNNKPRLTASDIIRDKRDAVIYQAEKQRFQNKRCGNKNVKYYNNGTVRSMESYKLQKSLARGNVLCEDCDDKGLLCNGPSEKEQLGQIDMGNNYVSEYWGGAKLKNWTMDISNCFTVITDVSGNRNHFDSAEDCLGELDDTSVSDSYENILIDPSNTLFPDELCDPFRYLKKTNLKTYLVITSKIQNPSGTYLNCSDNSANIVNQLVDMSGINGVVKSVCCIGPEIFDIYVELFYIQDYSYLGNILTNYPSIDISGGTVVDNVTQIRIFQGTIPTKQTKHNATRQSYMSCLENGTRKINFTKNTV